jgi:hypothetical protein
MVSLLLSGLAPAPVPAQQAPLSAVSFQFSRPGLEVPRFTLVIHEDGSGSYQADVVEALPAKFAAYAPAADTPPTTHHIDRTITISPPTVQKIFSTARSLKLFNIPCASKAKNIADTGTKTLSYDGEGGSGSCTYNYSDNKTVFQLTELFQAIAFTMDQGRKLEYDHRYDRLGLDSDMTLLNKSVDEKNAVELGNIAPILSAIAVDTALIERVRLRASQLLTQAAESH